MTPAIESFVEKRSSGSGIEIGIDYYVNSISTGQTIVTATVSVIESAVI